MYSFRWEAVLFNYIPNLNKYNIYLVNQLLNGDVDLVQHKLPKVSDGKINQIVKTLPASSWHTGVHFSCSEWSTLEQ